MEQLFNAFNPTTGTLYRTERFSTIKNKVLGKQNGSRVEFKIPKTGVGFVGLFLYYKKTTGNVSLPIEDFELRLGTKISYYKMPTLINYLCTKFPSMENLPWYNLSYNKFIYNIVPILLGRLLDDEFDGYYPFPTKTNLDYTLFVTLRMPSSGTFQTAEGTIELESHSVAGNALPIDSLYYPICMEFTSQASNSVYLHISNFIGSLNTLIIPLNITETAPGSLVISINGVVVHASDDGFSTGYRGGKLLDIFVNGKIYNDSSFVYTFDNEVDMVGNNLYIKFPNTVGNTIY